ERGRRVHDLRTSVCLAATVKQALAAAGQRIAFTPVSEGKIRAREGAIDLGGACRAAGLTEAHIERDHAAADMWEGAVEYDRAACVAIETEMDQRADVASALRGTHHDRFGIRHQCRIGVAGVVFLRGFEECAEIARRGKPDAEHERILRPVGQLIKTAWLETGRIA